MNIHRPQLVTSALLMMLLVFTGSVQLSAASGSSRLPSSPLVVQEEGEGTTQEEPAQPTVAAQDETSDLAQPIESADADDDENERGWHEQSIYIPYEKLREVFEKDGRGVFLTYEKFQELWQKAQAASTLPTPSERPVGPVIQQIASRATIGQAVVTVNAEMAIEIPPQGWSEVPLRLRGAAIRSATLDDEPARVIFDAANGYKLIVENNADAPVQKVLKLEYLKAFAKSPGESIWSVQPPQSTINRWEISVPTAGMDVTVEPLLAATRETQNNQDGNEQELLVAFVGTADQVRLKWNPKTEGAAGLEAFATVRTEQQLIIGDGVVRSLNRLDYEISRAALETLSFQVPADHKVINVYDRNVRKWDVTAEGDLQTITVELFEPARQSQSVVVELEKFIEVGDGVEIKAPQVAAQQVGRQQGIVVARLEGGLQGEATQRRGLLQMDTSELSASLIAHNWEFAFRYGALPFELTLNVRKVAPRIQVVEATQARLTADALELDWYGRFNIQDAGVFQLQVDLPEGFEVRNVVGTDLGGQVNAAVVESFHLNGDSATRWMINLSQRAFGMTGLQVQLRRRLEDPNLKSPTGTPSTLAVGLPHVAPDGIEQSEGTLLLMSPETLRVNPAEVTGLRTISVGEAASTIPQIGNTGQGMRPVLAYAYSGQTATLTISASRREPYVTAVQLLSAEVESGVIRYQARFEYNIRYSGVESLRIDIPQSVADQARNLTSGLRRQTIDPPPADVAEGDVAWSFAAESELLGSQIIELEWEIKIEELGLGKSMEFDVPVLKPRGVDRATGMIALTKSESIDIYPVGQGDGLRAIDPNKDLPPSINATQAAMAFEFVDAWELKMGAVRYELQESKRTSIEKAVVRVVALSQGELSLQAIYRMRSAEQRLAIQLPEGAEFDAQPLRIDGQSVTPERGADNIIFAPLSQQSLKESFVLELRYSISGTAAELSLPVFPSEPAQQKVFLCAFLPPKTVLIGSRGPWTDVMMESLPVGNENTEQINVENQEELVAWVTGDRTSSFNSATQFPVGQNEAYVFSTLRPANPPDGALRLQTVPRVALQTLMFVVLAIVALPLYSRSLRLQLALVGLILVAALVGSVFAPRLIAAMSDKLLWIGLLAVAVIWGVGHLRRLSTLSRQMFRPAQPASASSATAASAESATSASSNESQQSSKSESDSSDAADKEGEV